jgi:F-type H+-transporting ATPase subunit alpha
VGEMAISLFAVDRGYLDDVPLAKIGDFESALHRYLSEEKAELLAKINETGDFNDEIEQGLRQTVESFKASHAY